MYARTLKPAIRVSRIVDLVTDFRMVCLTSPYDFSEARSYLDKVPSEVEPNMSWVKCDLKPISDPGMVTVGFALKCYHDG